jgi:tRNA C32,U32 (ribose-2'-O)-methylase TrmJ
MSETSPGDTFNLSGDFRGANVTIKSTLTQVSQRIGTLPNTEPSEREELQQLVAQLNEALQQVPPAQAEEAEAVAQSAEALVGAATPDKPNKTMLRITAEGFKQAAQHVADVLPSVVTIATQIASVITKMTGA